jgi:uncharacterized sodium:solute symporter family permease YidK
MRTVTPSATAWKIKTDNEIDLTPWKGAKWVGAVLVLLVIGIYAAFAGRNGKAEVTPCCQAPTITNFSG